MKPQKRLFYAALCSLFACAPAVASAADTYPERPIRVIVPFPPGGSNDVLSRYMGIKLSERMGQQFVIDNRGGGNGIIGAQLAAEAPADGHTLLIHTMAIAVNVSLYKNLPFDTQKDLAPIMTVATTNGVLLMPASQPVQSVKEMIALAKSPS